MLFKNRINQLQILFIITFGVLETGRTFSINDHKFMQKSTPTALTANVPTETGPGTAESFNYTTTSSISVALSDGTPDSSSMTAEPTVITATSQSRHAKDASPTRSSSSAVVNKSTSPATKPRTKPETLGTNSSKTASLPPSKPTDLLSTTSRTFQKSLKSSATPSSHVNMSFQSSAVLVTDESSSVVSSRQTVTLPHPKGNELSTAVTSTYSHNAHTQENEVIYGSVVAAGSVAIIGLMAVMALKKEKLKVFNRNICRRDSSTPSVASSQAYLTDLEQVV